MGNEQTRVAVQVRFLSHVLSEFEIKFKSPDLSNEDWAVYQAKSDSIRDVLYFLFVIKDNASAKKRKLLSLCIDGAGCTTKDALELNYNSVDSMYKARKRLMDELQRTVLNEKKIDSLLKSRTIEEVEEIRKWYSVNVFNNNKLISRLSV